MASNAQPGSRLRRKTCNHLGAYLLSRNQFHGPGVDLVETALDFAVPGGLDLLFRPAVPVLKKVLNEPVHLTGRQLTGIFENFCGGAAHGEIVARNRSLKLLPCGLVLDRILKTGAPGLKIEIFGFGADCMVIRIGSTAHRTSPHTPVSLSPRREHDRRNSRARR